MFHVSCLGIWWRHDIWISEKLKSDYLKNKKSFRVLKALSFRHTKQTSKNVMDTTFKDFVCYFSYFFTNWQPLNNYKKSFLCHLKSFDILRRKKETSKNVVDTTLYRFKKKHKSNFCGGVFENQYHCLLGNV